MTPPSKADTSRVFFAVWPDASVRATLASLARDCAAQAGGRPAVSSNLHLTLAFVGEVATSRVATLRAIGLAASSAAAPFTLTLDRVGAFRSAGIVWVGAATLPPELERIVRELNGELSNAGFPTERRAFQPHVTLARRCRKAANPELAAPIPWRVESVALNVSESLRGGVSYRALAEWPLPGRAPDR
jgi:2'-5' RNA ligase